MGKNLFKKKTKTNKHNSTNRKIYPHSNIFVKLLQLLIVFLEEYSKWKKKRLLKTGGKSRTSI